MGYRHYAATAACAPDMQAQDELLAAYESLRCRSRHMLDSARAGEWDVLIDQESDYVVEVDSLQRLDARLKLDDRARERKAALLEEILEQDMEIRRCLVARRDELSEMIAGSRQQLALSRTYGPQQGGSVLDAQQRFTDRSS